MSLPASTGDPPDLEPLTQQFVDAMAGEPPLHTRAVADARAFLDRLQSAPVGRPNAQIDDLILPAGPTGSVRIRLVRPRNTQDALPVVLYFHGGGWMLGGTLSHDRLIREIAVGASVALVFVACDRAPETQYPIAVEQAYAATRYIADHAQGLNVDAARIAVMGDGAGGNIAAAVTLMAKARRGPRIDLQVLFYPVLAAGFDTQSYVRFAGGPWLTKADMECFWDTYLPDIARRGEITATPLGAAIAELTNLPDALIIVAENDVLRDEGEAYARKLSDAGVRVTSVRYNGTIHDFLMLNALADTPSVRGAVAQTICALKVVFG